MQGLAITICFRGADQPNYCSTQQAPCTIRKPHGQYDFVHSASRPSAMQSVERSVIGVLTGIGAFGLPFTKSHCISPNPYLATPRNKGARMIADAQHHKKRCPDMFFPYQEIQWPGLDSVHHHGKNSRYKSLCFLVLPCSRGMLPILT